MQCSIDAQVPLHHLSQTSAESCGCIRAVGKMFAAQTGPDT